MRRCGVLGVITALAAAAIAHAASAPISAADQLAAERIAVGTCASCHGRKGHSVFPQFPVLAGQQVSYLIEQLDAFKARKRGDPEAVAYMWGMAAPLDTRLIAALASYYSHQQPRAGARGNPTLIAKGRKIYHSGDPAQGVPPCAACHGQNAEGGQLIGGARTPRLAGQHAVYLLAQLDSFRTNLRDVAVMHGVARGLPQDDMRAVAAYLQSLGP